MKHRNSVLRARPLTVALRAALATLAVASIAPAAMADSALQALIAPTDTLSIGGIYSNHDSDLFGQYNGLENSGPTLLGGFSLRGGNGYGQQPGANTWFVQGQNLGTTSRSISGGMADQGNWSVGLSFDQLRNYGGDSLVSNPGSFQTPLVGAPGSNVFTLPSTFGYINPSYKNASGLVGTQALTPDQQQFFHTDHLYVQRATTRFSASHQFKEGWNMTFDWTNIRESGSILASAIVDSVTGATFTGSSSNLGGQRLLGLPYPTQYKTNNFNLALNWAGEKGFFTGAYYGSMFHDDYNGVWFANPYVSSGTTAAAAGSTYPMDVESLPPSNSDNELQFSGGYRFSPRTQLVGGYTYGRNTQNMSYAYEPAQIGTGPTSLLNLPVGSLNGLVVTQHANWSLSNQTTRNLTLSAGMIYSKRDNQTPSNLYNFEAPDSGPTTDWFSVYNIPMSNSHLQSKLAADWRFMPGQRLHLSAQNEKIRRWCDSTAYLGQTILAADGNDYSPTGCAAVPDSSENTGKVDYFLRYGDNLNLRAGLKYAKRTATLNPYYYNPITDDTIAGNGENDQPGWVAFFDGSRKQEQAHFGLSWAPSSAVNLSVDGSFGNDQYGDTALGRRSGHDATVDLQGDFQVRENATASLFATWQRETSGTLSAGSQRITVGGVRTQYPFEWMTDATDQAITLGAGFKQRGLMDDKLSLGAKLTYSDDTTSYSTAVQPGANFAVVNTYCTTPSTSGYTCGTVPDIKTRITRLDLNGTYKFNPHAKLQLGYLYARYEVNDYMYLAQQMGYTATAVLPWNVQNPSASISAIYAEYTYSFQ